MTVYPRHVVCGQVSQAGLSGRRIRTKLLAQNQVASSALGSRTVRHSERHVHACVQECERVIAWHRTRTCNKSKSKQSVQKVEVEVEAHVEVVIYKFTEQTLHMVEQSILGEALAF